uniref:Uncharacterized protein n=1 Tax=Setaria viridis TaxID=4556 RepID=A0A4U6TJQ9_SETVI|nr:hypothetical protein SEVIR_8G256800v2 [Setaria viridis]
MATDSNAKWPTPSPPPSSVALTPSCPDFASASVVPLPAPPPGHLRRWPRVELCVIPHTLEVEANEVVLERALVTVFAGSRPGASSSYVKAYLESHFDVEPGSFLVYPHYLEDFLIIFKESIAMLQYMY